jgi:hypothetical protein
MNTRYGRMRRVELHASPSLRPSSRIGDCKPYLSNDEVQVKLEGLRHEGVCRSECIDPHFLDLATSWRWVVNFTPRPLYPRGKSPRYTLDRRLGGPRSGLFGEEKILEPSETQTPTPRSSSP